MSDYVMVPREPTGTMCLEGHKAIEQALRKQIDDPLMAHVYRVMLAAAPPPPATDEEIFNRVAELIAGALMGPLIPRDLAAAFITIAAPHYERIGREKQKEADAQIAETTALTANCFSIPEITAGYRYQIAAAIRAQEPTP